MATTNDSVLIDSTIPVDPAVEDLDLINLPEEEEEEEEAEDDDLHGGSDSDFMAGGLGNDLIDGAEGDDELDGGDGNDILTGGLGNDILHAGFGLDSLTGGEGSDIFSFYAEGDFVAQDFDGSADKLVFESETTGISDIEDLLESISSIEDTDEGVTISFQGVASITLIGVHSDDLTADMVDFTFGGI